MPSFWKVLTTARGPGVGGTMKWVIYRPMPRMPPRPTMDFLVRRENSFAREDRMTKPESQKTGMETTKPVRPRTTSAALNADKLQNGDSHTLGSAAFFQKDTHDAAEADDDTNACHGTAKAAGHGADGNA